ncbi:MAG: hypothetical protein U1F43_34820 [Myxococcota bacterium]
MRPSLPLMSSCLAVLAGVLAPSVPARADAPPPPPEVVRPAAVEQAIRDAQASMRAALAKQYPADQIVVRVEPGSFDTVVAVAAFPGAYPGTGVMRQLIDAKSGVTYGVRGAKSFADFVRERGWLAQRPADDAIVRILNTALFEGIAILDDRAPSPKISSDRDGLHIEVIRRFMPSSGGQWLVVTVPPAGPEVVTTRRLE